MSTPHSTTRDHHLYDALITLLGETDFLRLVEEYGGTRTFIPKSHKNTELSNTLGELAALRLAKAYAANYLRVPLARDFRARQYRAMGLSNAKIARRLGITETGVDKIFTRVPVEVKRPKTDDRQIDMFPLKRA